MPARALWCAGMRVTSRPRKDTVPLTCRCRPIRHRTRVVLPAPLRPASETTSPSFTRTSTPCSACAWPYHAVRPVTSSMFGLTQVRGDHPLVGADLVVASLGQDPALLQHRHPVG